MGENVVKELIINKPSDLFNILNRKQYTKLILNCEVSPKLLRGFDNIRELTISNKTLVNYHINEQNINSYSFRDNLEIINFVNIKYFGHNKIHKKNKKDKGPNHFSINCSNLKKINFKFTKGYIIYLTNNYFKDSNNIEEIIVDVQNEFRFGSEFYVPESIKRAKIKFQNKEFNIDFLYNPKYITYFYFSENSKEISLKHYNNSVSEVVTIDIISEKLETKTIFYTISDQNIQNNSLFIPDYVTEIQLSSINYYEKIEDISFNINLLKNIKTKTIITDNKYLSVLKTITIRNNSEMSLYPTKVINVNDIGILKDLYIENNNLYIVYDKEKLIVNTEGIMTREKIEKVEKKVKEEKPEEKLVFDLDRYSISELEEYLQYRKLLESFKNNNDEELIKAVNLVGKKLVKKINKGDTNG